MPRTLRCLPVRTRGLAAILMISLSWLGSARHCDAQFTHGIDVSEWQGSINWNAVKNAGNEFAFIRATYGRLNADDYFQTNRIGAMATGMYVGFYHFANIDTEVGPNDAFNEANHFVNNIQSVYQQGGKLLPPVIDVERHPNLGSTAQNKVYISQWVRDFASVVKTRLGITPIIYCNTYYASTFFESDLTQYGLFVANYNSAPPTVPANIDGVWSNWDFWQYTETGSVSGVNGGVDRNVYNGTVSQMIANFAVTKPSADFNADGVTDGNDFLIWQRNYGQSGSSTFAQGDANRNGVVTGADLTLWKQYFGQSSLSTAAAAGAAAAIPEPSAMLLGAMGAVASVLGISRRRRQR